MNAAFVVGISRPVQESRRPWWVYETEHDDDYERGWLVRVPLTNHALYVGIRSEQWP